MNLSFLPDGRRAELLQPLSYNGASRIWRAPAGLIFDGASIPRVFWWLIGSPFTGMYRRWAVIHDAYYHDHRGVSRKTVDRQFRRGIREDGVPPWRAWLIYLAVRIGGKKSWDINNSQSTGGLMQKIGMVITAIVLLSGCAYVSFEKEGMRGRYVRFGDQNLNGVGISSPGANVTIEKQGASGLDMEQLMRIVEIAGATP